MRDDDSDPAERPVVPCCLHCWAWLDTVRTRHLIGLDPETGAVAVVGPLTAVDPAEPPAWAITVQGRMVALNDPGLPRDGESADRILDAVDRLREGGEGGDLRLVPWRPPPRRLPDERRTA